MAALITSWLLRAVKNVGRRFDFPVETRGGFPQFLGTLNILGFRVGNGITLENLKFPIASVVSF